MVKGRPGSALATANRAGAPPALRARQLAKRTSNGYCAENGHRALRARGDAPDLREPREALGLARAEITLNSLFTDGMILQTNTKYGARSFLYGTASPGETVTVAGHGSAAVSAVADADGAWRAQMNPQQASEDTYFNLTVTGDAGGAGGGLAGAEGAASRSARCVHACEESNGCCGDGAVRGRQEWRR